MLKSIKSPYSLASIAILCYVLIRAAFFLANWEKSFILTWDVFGYYLYLPALFIYNQLGDLSFVPEILDTYYNNAPYYYGVPQDSGNMILKYPGGLAVMYMPFFFLGHIGAHLFGYPADGFSLPYQFAIAMGSIFFVVMGLVVLKNVLRKYFDDITVACCLLIIVLGTNLFNYTAYDGPYAHGYLFTLFVIILRLTQKWHEQPKLKTAIYLGLLIGLAAITRPINIIIVLIPLLWGMSNKKTFQDKIQLLLSHWKHVLFLAISMIAVGSIQLIYWKIYSGNFLFYSYEDQGFDFLSPHILDGIFSYRKGWLIYTPIMVLSLVGFRFLYKKHRELFFPILIMCGLHSYIVFSWEVWWYGGAFGQRPMIDIYGLLTLPLAALIASIKGHKIKMIALAIFCFLCIDLNLMMTWQAHAPGGGMYTETSTGQYYWKIFGSTHAKRADKLYIDIKYDKKDWKGYQAEELYFNDMESDSTAKMVTSAKKNGEEILFNRYQKSSFSKIHSNTQRHPG